MNTKTIKEFMPLGSVVTLLGGTKKIMICGRIQEDKGTDTVYDYSACYYPEGILDPNGLFLFQHEDIDKVYYVGLQDSDEHAFRGFVEQRLSEMGLLEDVRVSEKDSIVN